MLYILIPCLLLLIVAIVLKKRESANNESSSEKGKKTVTKKAGKTASSRAGRTSTTPPKVAAAPVATEPTSTTLDSEVRSSIENLIKAENYFAAEAKINQALNQDNTQHELYLYLLEIHVAQKDDFAIKQLINYLRSLGLHDIADQAEAKQQRAQSTQIPTPEPKPEVVKQAIETPSPAQTLKSDAVFDELIQTPSTATPASFDTLQSEIQTAPVEQKDYAPIEYTIEKKQPAEEAPVLEFESVKAETPVEEVPVTAIPETKVEAQPEVAPLEFNFSTPAETKEEPVKPVEDFVFDAPSVSEDKSAQSTPEFKLDAELPVTPVSDFHFSLDTPISADPTSLAFETQKIEIAPILAEPEASAEELAHADDPLAQSFPELLKVNEIQLNLDLANRYIELGAYESAKKLLNADDATLSHEQRERTQNLLKRIAS